MIHIFGSLSVSTNLSPPTYAYGAVMVAKNDALITLPCLIFYTSLINLDPLYDFNAFIRGKKTCSGRRIREEEPDEEMSCGPETVPNNAAHQKITDEISVIRPVMIINLR